MEKYSSARAATASVLWLSGLGHVQSKTMKDKAVSNGSLAQLRLSFILLGSLGHTPDRSSAVQQQPHRSGVPGIRIKNLICTLSLNAKGVAALWPQKTHSRQRLRCLLDRIKSINVVKNKPGVVVVGQINCINSTEVFLEFRKLISVKVSAQEPGNDCSQQTSIKCCTYFICYISGG